MAVRNSEMRSFNGLAPFPNGMFYNWATIFILGFGNLSALDFQVRAGTMQYSALQDTALKLLSPLRTDT